MDMAPHDGGIASPAALPRGTWADTLKRTVREFREDKLQHWAAALTYYSVLSIFPALLVMVSLLGLFGDPERITKVLTDDDNPAAVKAFTAAGGSLEPLTRLIAWTF